MKFISDRMGIPNAYFADRWVISFKSFSIRLHHWKGSDDPDAFHDHPSWFTTLVLWGGYNDIAPDGVDKLRFGSFRFRKAVHMHTVQNRYKNTWTLCIFGNASRRWSFLFKEKKMKRDKYFAEIGHHTATKDRIRLRPDGSLI